MAIGGFIGLQSTISSTAKAETEIIHVHTTDTVTNYIIDKRIFVETDTIVRNRYIQTPVKDELWAAKALRLVPMPITGLPEPAKEELANSVSIE